MYYFKKNIFISQVFTLLSGTALAQLITVLIAPLLSRVYSPEAFGLFAVFIAIVSTISPAITGRYDLAAIVVKEPIQSRYLYDASIVFNATVSILLFVFVVSGGGEVYFPDDIDTSEAIFYLIPCLVFFTGLITAGKSWANKNEQYRTISISLIYQNLVAGAAALIIGLYFDSSYGLIYAAIFGPIVAWIYIYRSISPTLSIARKFQLRNLINIMIRFKDYPIFNASTAILNGLTTSLPVFFLAKYFGAAEVGFYALLIRVGALPLSAVADAVSRVSFKKITSIINSGSCALQFLWQMAISLTLLASVPSVLLMIFAPRIFSVVFGSEWEEAGRLLTVLMPALAIQFVVSILTPGFLACGKLRVFSAWQVFSFIVTVIVFFVFGSRGDINDFFLAYMVKDIILYSLCFVILWFCLRKPLIIKI